MKRFLLSVLLSGLLVSISLPATATKFRFPVDDTSRIMFEYVVYSDHDPAPGLQYECLPWCAGMTEGEWECGENYPYCYDGHDGTDFMLVDGFVAMDEGSADLVAAADGVVVSVEDGNYDRCEVNLITQEIDCHGHPMIGNHVKIRHADGMETWYWHFKKDSIIVEMDQEVACGDVLGSIGSSGYSSQPHLHFEVRMPTGVGDQTEWIDPFAGPFSQEESLWVLQWNPNTWLPGCYCEGDEVPDFSETGEDVASADVAFADDPVVAEEIPEQVEWSQDIIDDAGAETVSGDVEDDVFQAEVTTDIPETVADTYDAGDSAFDSVYFDDSAPVKAAGGCHAGPFSGDSAASPYALLLLSAGVIVAFALRRRDRVL